MSYKRRFGTSTRFICYPHRPMQRVAYLLVPDFQVMVFSGLSVFELANQASPRPHYDVRLISETGGPVRSSLGYSVTTDALDATDFDTVITGGAIAVGMASPAVIGFLNQALSTSRRVASMCTGAFYLAQAGLLDGRRVTTHWAYARQLQANYPKSKVEEDRIFIVDGPIWTSAGMTAGTDLALAMVEKDLGVEAARHVARKLVMSHRRSGGQLQHSALLDLDAKSDRIQSALAYAKNNLSMPLSVSQLADAANLSSRQFSRAFRAETGHSPAKAVENLRVEAARSMMEQGRLPIDVVARETGFADRDRMRRAFLRAFGQPPQAIRRNSRGHADRHTQ
jgi:transcriptional regulator GlxA family with amidase domain